MFWLLELIKHTNLDIKDSACLHVVHILQHPTSCPTRRSTHNTKVNALRKSFSPLPAGRYGKSSNKSSRRHHQVNEETSGLDVERVRAVVGVCSLRSKKQHPAEKRHKMHFLGNEVKAKSIEDFVEAVIVAA
jgi:hypothetical protein